MSAPDAPVPDLATWRARARAWLAEELPRRDGQRSAADLAVFHDHDDAAEQALLDAAGAWQRRKLEAGYGAVTWPTALGGAGLPGAFAAAFHEEEAAFATPTTTELVPVTLELIAPTVAAFGTPEQQAELIGPMLRGEAWACQLFSEPGAGSDLAGLSCKAVPDGDGWVVTGQKVWTSGARFARHGLLIARHDGASKHGGLTAFVIPLDLPGISIQPIRQMSGGSPFNEVFLDEVRVPDAMRLGEVGQGWSVTLTTLELERASSGARTARPGGTIDDALATARRLGRTTDPDDRQALASLYTTAFVQDRYADRVADLAARGVVGAEGSILKLLWVRNLVETSEVASRLVGAHLTAAADPELHAWAAHVLGAPGYRIAGGSDEIQRTILAERLLGLPRSP